MSTSPANRSVPTPRGERTVPGCSRSTDSSRSKSRMTTAAARPSSTSCSMSSTLGIQTTSPHRSSHGVLGRGTNGFDLELGDRLAGFLRGDGESFNAGFPVMAANRWYEAATDDQWRVLGSGCADVVYDTPTLRAAARLAFESFAPGEFSAEQSCMDIDFDRCPAETLIPPGWLPFDNPCPES